MIIFPAIDIKGGKVVRLRQGKFSEVTEYSSDPLATAQHWVSQGAQWLHLVDLDGAQTGEMKNFEIIEKIANEVRPVQIQVGGGIRSKAGIKKLLDSGVGRVILGTKAVEWPGIIEAFPAQRIAVSLDCRDGKVTTKGWTSVVDIKAYTFADELVKDYGLRYLIYTDIKTDGMLMGPNFTALEELLDAVDISVIASGGISDLEDIKKLLSLSKRKPHLMGAIIGKALYDGKINLEEALRLCSPNA
jgi:phosphoribosylformimino-5-aminoimidazole carboxamide ribotide isomerase